MRDLLIIAGKEVREAVRNRWVVAATLLLGALALSLTFLGSAPTGTVGVNALDVVVVSLSSLTILLLPLVALLLSHDAIIGEIERGTMLLLLSYPVERWQVVLGKFTGHLAVMAIATLVGFGAAGVAMALTGTEIGRASWIAFGSMTGLSVLLGAAFVAIGYCASALARSRGAAAALAVCVWLWLVVVYDMLLLGLLVADQGQNIGSAAVNFALLANPADVYRMLNLSGFANVSLFSGMSGIADTLSVDSSVLLASLALWIVLPLGIAIALFARREI